MVDAEAWIAHCAAAWQAGSEFHFGVFNHHDGELLGGVGLNEIDRVRGCGNLGYWVADQHRGRGIATRAAALAVAMGFQELGLGRIEVVVLTHNAASRRVAVKLGGVPEDEVPDRLVFQGHPAPAVVYALMPASTVRSGHA